jgi:ribosomal protein L22
MTEKQYAPSKTEKKRTQKVKENLSETNNKGKLENKKEKTEKEISDEKIEDKKNEKKKVEVKKVKKDFAIVNGKNVPVSTKESVAVCKFIMRKEIKKAIEDLNEVLKLKKAVPMKGEIPHRKGKIMAGRFPKRTSEEFIILLKSLGANAIMHEVENPVITEAIANKAQRPFGKGGRVKKKRTHITIIARTKKINEKLREKK